MGHRTGILAWFERHTGIVVLCRFPGQLIGALALGAFNLLVRILDLESVLAKGSTLAPASSERTFKVTKVKLFEAL